MKGDFQPLVENWLPSWAIEGETGEGVPGAAVDADAVDLNTWRLCKDILWGQIVC